MAPSFFRAAFAVFCSLAASFAVLAVPTVAAAQSTVGSESKYSAIVIDAHSGEVLYARAADNLRYPASITKIMTLYLAFEAMAEGRLSPQDSVVVSKHAASMQPTKLGLRAGATITLDNALRAISVQSANDMAVAVAEKIGGTESRFAALMTLRAQELGMENTRFVNASGLPNSRQVSSARDIALLSRAMMRDFPQYYSYLGQQRFTYNGQSSNNHNHLLGSVEGVDGLKTGFINASGYNLSASAMRDGRRLITVVLGGSSTRSRDAHVTELLETGFEVMRRRDQGERVTVAQYLFQPLPTGPQVPSFAQGDSDAPSRVQVADRTFDIPLRGPQPPASSLVLATITAPAPFVVTDPGTVIQVAMTPVPNPTSADDDARPAAASRPSRPAGRYMVQVGAFKQKQAARTHLTTMSKRFSSHFGRAEAQVGAKVGGFFQARFTGFTADAARAACSALKAKRMSCLVVAP